MKFNPFYKVTSQCAKYLIKFVKGEQAGQKVADKQPKEFQQAQPKGNFSLSKVLETLFQFFEFQRSLKGSGFNDIYNLLKLSNLRQSQDYFIPVLNEIHEDVQKVIKARGKITPPKVLIIYVQEKAVITLKQILKLKYTYQFVEYNYNLICGISTHLIQNSYFAYKGGSFEVGGEHIPTEKFEEHLSRIRILFYQQEGSSKLDRPDDPHDVDLPDVELPEEKLPPILEPPPLKAPFGGGSDGKDYGVNPIVTEERNTYFNALMQCLLHCAGAKDLFSCLPRPHADAITQYFADARNVDLS